ncbi:MAG: redoxin domain-containing protein [Nitrospirae bacterium]|nr:redoxin domain-containing protein [Nitrospirota bacterium]
MGRIRNAKKIILVLSAAIFIATYGVSLTYPTKTEALLQTGDNAPDFTLKDIEGRETGLSRFSQKKAVIILFWSTWSVNSSVALKRFEEYYKKYKDREILVVGINADNQTISDEDMEAIKKLVKELNISFPILVDRGLKTFHSYNVIALPSTIVIAEGKVSYTLPGLPLVGTEDMFDYLLVLAGETPLKKVEPKYMPPYNVVADTNIARQFIKKGMNEMARAFLQKAINKDPRYIPPYIELAKIYESQDKGKEAEEILRKALTADTENIIAMSELGYLLAKKGRPKEAIEILSRAIKMDSYTPAYYYMAYALAKNGQMKEALIAFDSAISLNPYDPAIYLLRAEVYEGSRMLKEAASDYKRYLELLLKVGY